jgi:hypothetical protein
MFGFQLGKMMSRNHFEHVTKDCDTMGYSPESPVCLIGYAKPSLTDSQEFSGLFNQLTGQNCSNIYLTRGCKNVFD